MTLLLMQQATFAQFRPVPAVAPVKPPVFPLPKAYPFWGDADVARAVDGERAAVQTCAWAMLEAAMQWQTYWRGHGYPDDVYADVATMTGLLATVRVEVGRAFVPIREYGGYDYAEGMYGYQTAKGKELGNTAPGDGYRYRGGGWIQRTGRGGYEAEMKALRDRLGISVDLVGYPELILDPKVSALVAVNFFVSRGLEAASRAGYGGNVERWRYVRYRVNGGTNGLADFLKFVANLGELPIVQTAVDLSRPS